MRRNLYYLHLWVQGLVTFPTVQSKVCRILMKNRTLQRLYIDCYLRFVLLIYHFSLLS
jgi:hypothetical protein